MLHGFGIMTQKKTSVQPNNSYAIEHKGDGEEQGPPVIPSGNMGQKQVLPQKSRRDRKPR